jgi:glycosyltransferase involved in cell wall biosynthesis
MPFRGVTDNIRLSSPNKLFDYTMAGLALAAGDLPFLRSVVLGYDAGLLFNKTTSSGIAETLNAMTSDRKSLARFKKNARAAAEDAFSWERQFAHYPWKP